MKKSLLSLAIILSFAFYGCQNCDEQIAAQNKACEEQMEEAQRVWQMNHDSIVTFYSRKIIFLDSVLATKNTPASKVDGLKKSNSSAKTETKPTQKDPKKAKMAGEDVSNVDEKKSKMAGEDQKAEESLNKKKQKMGGQP